MKSKKLKRKIDRLWQLGKKDLDKILKDTTYLVKKGETHIKNISKKAEENLEAMVFTLQREKLYYGLGKYLAKLTKSKWANSKKAKNFLIQIKNTSREIQKLTIKK